MGRINYTTQQLDNAIQKVQDNYADISGVTATADKVLVGSKFVDSSGNLIDGTLPETQPINLQSNKNASGSFEQDEIVTPDADYDALSQVTIKKITADDIPNDSTVWNSIINNIPNSYKQDKTISPTTSNQTVKPDNNKILSQVIINAVTHDIDSKIQPENIKAGITILNVPGTYEGIMDVESEAQLNQLLSQGNGQIYRFTSQTTDTYVEGELYSTYNGNDLYANSQEYDLDTEVIE